MGDVEMPRKRPPKLRIKAIKFLVLSGFQFAVNRRLIVVKNVCENKLSFNLFFSLIRSQHNQRTILNPLLRKALEEGDYWRIIPFKWLEVWTFIIFENLNQKQNWKQEWKKYIEDNDGIQDEELQQLDISTLFLNGHLRPGLKEERDYTIVPEAAYEVRNQIKNIMIRSLRTSSIFWTRWLLIRPLFFLLVQICKRSFLDFVVSLETFFKFLKTYTLVKVFFKIWLVIRPHFKFPTQKLSVIRPLFFKIFTPKWLLIRPDGDFLQALITSPPVNIY